MLPVEREYIPRGPSTYLVQKARGGSGIITSRSAFVEAVNEGVEWGKNTGSVRLSCTILTQGARFGSYNVRHEVDQSTEARDEEVELPSATSASLLIDSDWRDSLV